MPAEPSALLTPAEVAARFRVDPKTVTRWAKDGRLPCIRTLGGHRRFWRSDVDRLFNASAEPERDEAPPEDAEGASNL